MPKTPAKPAPKASVPAVVAPKGTAVMSYKDRLAALVAQTKKAETPTGGFISLKGGRMSVGEVRLPGDKIAAIIVDYRKDNQFFESAYEIGKSAAPVCAAVVRPHEYQSPWRKPRDGETDETPGLTWDEETGLVTESAKPQVPAGRGCDSCRLLEFNTAHLIKGKTGSGKGKACRESRRLFIAAADQCTTPDDIARAPILTLIPPPTSLDNFKRVANELTEVLDVPIFGGVVEISVEPDDKYLFTAQYKLVEAILDDGLVLALLNRHEEVSAKEVALPKIDDSDEKKDARGGKF
jgi:hypothetical protein